MPRSHTTSTSHLETFPLSCISLPSLVAVGLNRSLNNRDFDTFCEGDLLFTAAKYKSCHVWFTCNGERRGTCEGHNGAVNSHDISSDTTCYITGSGDFSARLWDSEKGEIGQWDARVSGELLHAKREHQKVFMDLQLFSAASGDSEMGRFVVPRVLKGLDSPVPLVDN